MSNVVTGRDPATGFDRGGRVRILSGALHYFRVLPEQWGHRLAMLRAMGLNTVETYVPWNLHEPRPGRYVFDGLADVEAFLGAAAAAQLRVILRPGPYICAEWDNGGLPSWLTGRPGQRIRCADPGYLAAVDAWFDVLIPRLVPHLVTRGGNVILVQVENEYGSYGTDREYLRHLRDGLRRRGIDVPLVTSDGAREAMLSAGTIPDVRATVNFGSEPEQAFAALARHRPQDPPFCMEFWCGWYAYWGGEWVTRDAKDAADVLGRILAAGADVNIYLAHGGTNFGAWAGAKWAPATDGYRPDGYRPEQYRSDITSYDYDAPIAEDGSPTQKFWEFRRILAGYAGPDLPEPPPPAPALAPSRIDMCESLPLSRVLRGVAAVQAATPPTFEELDLHHGLVQYASVLPGPCPHETLVLDGLADRAQVWVDGQRVATLDSGHNRVEVAVPGQRVGLQILVESMGRTNLGPRLGERKGILGGVRRGEQFVHGWSARPVPLTVDGLPWAGLAAGPGTGPVYHRGYLEVDRPGDARLALPGWTKGYVWVNGFCLGRYWSVGPQHSLYLPWPLLRAGRNEVVVLELDEVAEPVVEVLSTAPE
ncbi:MAG: beta-galactosidase [Micromonosporaceae bacterium]|nr:beta-galactosidase [Micromonosporaceae bacterium]